MEEPQTSFLASLIPFASMRFVLPTGAPRSASEALLSSIHFIHASVPCFRCSGVEFFIISAIPEASAMYKARNFFIAFLRPKILPRLAHSLILWPIDDCQRWGCSGSGPRDAEDRKSRLLHAALPL